MPLFSGQLINNRYRIDALLNQGNTGALYRAWDMNLKTPIAIIENLEFSPEAQEQFGREVELLASLTHSNLPRMIDSFTISGHGQYLVLEHIEGEDLQTILKDRGSLPQSDALDWTMQLSETLAYLRSQPVAPFYPSLELSHINIRPDPDGRVVLKGFDLLRHHSPGFSKSAGLGRITPGYSAPEQYGRGQVDARSDIYTLGAILYHLLTGQMPPESVQLVAGGAELVAPRQLNQEITPAVEQTILQAMALDANSRFQSLEEFQHQLLNLKFESTASTSPIAQPHTRKGWPAWLSGLAFIILGAIVGVALYLVLSSNMGPLAPATIAPVATDLSSQPTPTFTAEPTEAPAVLPTATTPAEVSSPAPVQETPENGPVDTPAPVETALPTLTSPPASPPADTPTPGPSPIIVDPLTEVPLVLVPSGAFIMGGPSGSADGQQAHTVTLDTFYVDQYEVTNARYKICVDDGACQPPANPASYTRSNYYDNPEYDDYPLIQISWDQANSYCAWRGARLPTEAEWEKAARGPDGLPYPWGEDADCSLANYWSTTTGACVGDTVVVGSYPDAASPYDLMDMAGNVWEWVSDWYAADYYTNSSAENPQGPSFGEFKVLRGGSWVSNELNSRSAFRNNLDPNSTSSNIGFRCVTQP